MMKKRVFLMLAVAIMPAMAFTADPNKAQVVTFKSNITACLASVAIKQVDGKLRQLPTMGFEIEPGWHTMHGTATVNLRHCPVNEERIRKSVSVPPLEWLFEAGKVYYVGFDHSSPERRNWQFVVWKVEDMEGAEEEQSQAVNSP